MPGTDPLVRQLGIVDLSESIARAAEVHGNHRLGIIADSQQAVVIGHDDPNADRARRAVDCRVDERNTAVELPAWQRLDFRLDFLAVADRRRVLGEQFQHEPDRRQIRQPVDRLTGLDVLTFHGELFDDRAADGCAQV